jgi:hypothetical protein
MLWIGFVVAGLAAALVSDQLHVSPRVTDLSIILFMAMFVAAFMTLAVKAKNRNKRALATSGGLTDPVSRQNLKRTVTRLKVWVGVMMLSLIIAPWQTRGQSWGVCLGCEVGPLLFASWLIYGIRQIQMKVNQTEVGEKS